MRFYIQRITRESFHVLSVGGYMGNEECRKLEAELEELHQQGHKHVIIDFVALTFITSASLSRLSEQVRRFQRAKCELKLAGLPPLAIRLIKVGGLESALKPAEDLAAAIKSISVFEPLALKQKCLLTGRGFLEVEPFDKRFDEA